MQRQDQAKTLFQLTAALTDSKVEVAVNKAITQVVEQIINLRHEVGDLRSEMHREMGGLRHEVQREIGGLKHDMIERFGKVESHLSSVETALGKRNQSRNEMRNRLYDYAFKAGWLILGSTITYLAVKFHFLF